MGGMKSDTKATAHLIMIYGAPGSGKSFFAEGFSEAFKAPYLDLNALRYKIFAQPNFSEEENRSVREVGHSILENLLKSGQTVVLEGCLDTKADRDETKRLIKKTPYEPLLVWVQTDLNTMRQRVDKGLATCKLTSKQFEDMISQLEMPS